MIYSEDITQFVGIHGCGPVHVVAPALVMRLTPRLSRKMVSLGYKEMGSTIKQLMKSIYFTKNQNNLKSTIQTYP